MVFGPKYGKYVQKWARGGGNMLYISNPKWYATPSEQFRVCAC